MKPFYFFYVYCFGFLALIYAAEVEQTGCLEREKALVSLETVETLLKKAGDSFPSCKDSENSTDETDCGKKKSLAYIEISKNLIADAKRNIPTCSTSINKDKKFVGAKIVEDKIVKDKIVEDKIVEDKNVEDKIVEDKIVEDKNVEDKIVEDEIVEDEIVEDKIVEDKDKIVEDKDKIAEDKDKIVEDDKILNDEKPRDCSEILANGHNKSGVYMIWKEEPITTGNSLQVYCDMKTDDGGWTVIQRRGKYAKQLDFYLDWESYKNGFGNINEEFWLGLENIRLLCIRGCEIRFDLQDEDGEKVFAHYNSFNLSRGDYILQIDGYSGNAGDAMENHNNEYFSTKDKGDIALAAHYRTGWWLGKRGYNGNLNGYYQPGGSNYETVGWYSFREYKNLASAEMKVRPK